MLKSSLFFSEFKPTRKEAEGMYLLVTNNSVLNKAQNKTDNLLQTFWGKRQATPNKNSLERKETSTHSQTKCHPMLQPYLKTLPKLLLNQWFTLNLPTNEQYPSPSHLNQPISTKQEHYPRPTFPPYLTFPLLHHFNHYQPRNVKFKPKYHQSLPQLQIIPPIINLPPHRGKMDWKTWRRKVHLQWKQW